MPGAVPPALLSPVHPQPRARIGPARSKTPFKPHKPPRPPQTPAAPSNARYRKCPPTLPSARPAPASALPINDSALSVPIRRQGPGSRKTTGAFVTYPDPRASIEEGRVCEEFSAEESIATKGLVRVGQCLRLSAETLLSYSERTAFTWALYARTSVLHTPLQK